MASVINKHKLLLLVSTAVSLCSPINGANAQAVCNNWGGYTDNSSTVCGVGAFARSAGTAIGYQAINLSDTATSLGAYANGGQYSTATGYAALNSSGGTYNT